WRSVAEDFSAFDANVTTVEPANIIAGGSIRNLITNRDQQFVKKGKAEGTAPFNGFANGLGPALNFITTDLTAAPPPGQLDLNRNTTILQGAGSLISHELGHALGLEHQPLSFQDGTGLPGVMTIGSGAPRSTEALATWVVGVNEKGQQQDDMAVISRQENGFG